MSTRCQIKVEGEEVMLYKHCDGYPEGVLPTLEDVVKKFREGRGFFDGSYLLARIGQRFMNDSDASSDRFRAEAKIKHEHHVLGYGYGTHEHGDIEYLYTVKKDWTITVEEK